MEQQPEMTPSTPEEVQLMNQAGESITGDDEVPGEFARAAGYTCDICQQVFAIHEVLDAHRYREHSTVGAEEFAAAAIDDAVDTAFDEARQYPPQEEQVGADVVVFSLSGGRHRFELIHTYARLGVAQILGGDLFDEAETIDVLDRIKELAS